VILFIREGGYTALIGTFLGAGGGRMIDARNYVVQETLRNGLRVTIRAIRPDDRDALLAAFKGLDDGTIRLRFFGPKKELSARELTAATEVDFVRTVALVTCVQDGAAEKIIGAGRYVAFGNADPPDRAEVAFTVEEDYQGLGISSSTLRHLAGIAKRMGIAQFHAEVLPENAGMLAVFARSGFPVNQKTSEGVTHVTLSLLDEAR
jgi:RimJ/RimL family protein N-acetyltransferase